MRIKKTLGRAAEVLLILDLSIGFKETIEIDRETLIDLFSNETSEVYEYILILASGAREERTPIFYYLSYLGFDIDIKATIK